MFAWCRKYRTVRQRIQLRVAAALLLALSASACGQSNGAAGAAAAGSPTSLNGTWTAGCTSAAGVAGIEPPASASYTSQLQINNTHLTYTVQGYTDPGCVTAGNLETYNYTLAAAGGDSVVVNAEDLNLTQATSEVCTPGCVANGGDGTVFSGLYLISGSTLSINWAAGTRPSTLGYTFTLQ